MKRDTDKSGWGTRTRAVHAGEHVDPVTRASAPNIVMSATFAPDRPAGFSALDESEYDGYTYARESNPTVDQLAEKIAALEEAPAALCFGSGMAACHALMAGRLDQGDHLIMSDANYVGAAELARDSLPRWGVTMTPVDTADPQKVADAIRPNTKMVWLETPSNPVLKLCDIAAIADLAHARGVRDVVVDSTFASPIATRPLALGADFVVHSLTKYIGGHGDAMGGAVVGAREALAELNLEAMVHYGGVLSPFNAWLILRGVATLPLRMRAHQEAALDVARFLEAHPAIAAVHYPGLPSHPQHALARRQMDNFAGLLTFQTREDGEAVSKRMIERLQVIHYAVSLGHHRSLVYWVPTDAIVRNTFRLDAQAEQAYRAYAGDGVFRFSAGIEDAQDLCADLARVLD